METEKQTYGWFVFNSGQVLIEKKENVEFIKIKDEKLK